MVVLYSASAWLLWMRYNLLTSLGTKGQRTELLFPDTVSLASWRGAIAYLIHDTVPLGLCPQTAFLLLLWIASSYIEMGLSPSTRVCVFFCSLREELFSFVSQRLEPALDSESINVWIQVFGIIPPLACCVLLLLSLSLCYSFLTIAFPLGTRLSNVIIRDRAVAN